MTEQIFPRTQSRPACRTHMVSPSPVILSSVKSLSAPEPGFIQNRILVSSYRSSDSYPDSARETSPCSSIYGTAGIQLSGKDRIDASLFFAVFRSCVCRFTDLPSPHFRLFCRRKNHRMCPESGTGQGMMSSGTSGNIRSHCMSASGNVCFFTSFLSRNPAMCINPAMKRHAVLLSGIQKGVL